MEYMESKMQARYDSLDDTAEYIKRLESIIRDFASSNAWHNFGDCRKFGGRLLQPHELDELALTVIKP